MQGAVVMGNDDSIRDVELTKLNPILIWEEREIWQYLAMNNIKVNKFSHASVVRRCLDHKNVNVISFGIRNISKDEISFSKKNKKKINIFWAKDKGKWDLRFFKNLIKNKIVYITLDVDVFDSSLMPATGTPEPGGLFWDEIIKIIKIAAKHSKIVGADINELSPIKRFETYNFLVAKLAYKILSYRFINFKF